MAPQRAPSGNYPKILLVVLDGFGEGPDFTFNAITRSKMPFYNSLLKHHAHTQLLTSGEAVGLPAGIMGNSEVGHMNMGAGRIVYQELTRIDKDISEGRFFRNKVLLDTLAKIKSSGSGARLHLMGLLSDGGVHSHINHWGAVLKAADERGVGVTLHIFTDGRDTPPTSSLKYVAQLAQAIEPYQNVTIGSVCGRFYAMDRDKRWDRVEKAYKVLTGQSQPWGSAADLDPLSPISLDNPLNTPQARANGMAALVHAIIRSHAAEVSDEFIEPVLLHSATKNNYIKNGDGLFFINFRADRAREILSALTLDSFNNFPTQKIKLSAVATMTQYDATYLFPVLYPPQNLSHMLPDIICAQGLSQFRLAETEKYAHVTFFFNGGREAPLNLESRTLVPSPKDVATYDLKPEMSAPEVTAALIAKLEAGDAHFILVNYANADMVGHTGNFDAAVKAMQFLDKCLEKAIGAATRCGYTVLITADHGNVEEMHELHDSEHIHTQHTLNPVPLVLVSPNKKFILNDGGVLADVAPTILNIMGLAQPKEMTGHSLIKGERS